MALHWKLVIDAVEPHALADFWAAALGYVVEDPGQLVAELVRNGDLPEAATVIHAGTPRFAGLAAVRHPDEPFNSFTGMGQGRRLLFQAVAEPKIGKNRLHIDVHDSERPLEDLARRLELLGATRVELIDQGPAGTWWVMHDPEGNEFCAVGA